MRSVIILTLFCAAMCALKPGEKMLDSHDEIEETEDGQKIKFHYEKKDIGNDQIQISVSSDVLDTAEDMAEAMADIPAKVFAKKYYPKQMDLFCCSCVNIYKECLNAPTCLYLFRIRT